MHLDVVELVMQIEEEFDITLADDDAKGVRTVGDLFQGILRQLAKRAQSLPKEVV